MPKRDTAHMGEQRDRILRATIRCIGQSGIERTSIAQICKEAGLSAGAVYTHFLNKDEVIAEALRFGSVQDSSLPNTWPELKRDMVSLDDQMGFDITTLAAAKLQILSSCMHPGPLHDGLKPLVQDSLDILVKHLRKLEAEGAISLKLSPLRTALAISTIVDGMTWIALASDRSLEETRSDISSALDCFVSSGPATGSRPHDAPSRRKGNLVRLAHSKTRQ